MTFLSRLGVRRAGGACAIAAAAFGWCLISSGLAQPAAPAKKGEQADPAAELYALGYKFQGAGTCANAACHGAPVGSAPAGGGYINPSYTQWNAPATAEAPADPHRNSFKTLSKPESVEIGKKLGIANVKADATCVACHSLNVPAANKGEQFSVAEGGTCNACHGPSGASIKTPADKGWGAAHTAKGWGEKQRTAFAGKHGELLKTTGFYDTRPLVERSHQCVDCHLAISPKITAAGHPQPTFEMNWYSVTYPNRHWTDPTDKYFSARLWAAGQAAALKAALHQLAERADPTVNAKPEDLRTAYMQALSHYTVFAPVFAPTGAGVAAPSWATITAELTKASKVLADPAKKADLSAAAEAAAKAAGDLAPAVDKWQPDKASTLKVVTALLANSLASYGGSGVEQQRSAIFALYSAYAASADKTPDAEANVNLIGEKLFPLDPKGAPLNAFKVPVAQHTAAIAELKAKIK